MGFSPGPKGRPYKGRYKHRNPRQLSPSLSLQTPNPPRTVHYVGFTDDRYWNAFRLFGGPRMIHRKWDRRAQRDIGPEDVVIFATGDETQPLAQWNGNDLDEG